MLTTECLVVKTVATVCCVWYPNRNTRDHTVEPYNLTRLARTLPRANSNKIGFLWNRIA